MLGTCISKFPFISEIVPIEVPFIRIFAPGILLPCSSVTVPEIVRPSCCIIDDTTVDPDRTSVAYTAFWQVKAMVTSDILEIHFSRLKFFFIRMWF